MKIRIQKMLVIVVSLVFCIYQQKLIVVSAKTGYPKEDTNNDSVQSYIFNDGLLYANQLHIGVETPVINDVHIFTEPVSDETYGLYELEWRHSDTDFFDILTSVCGNGVNIQYSYDENNNRTEKNVNGIITYYIYTEHGLLDTEYSEDYTIRYLYNIESDLAGFEYNGIRYLYNYTDGIITDIMSLDGEFIAHYEYEASLPIGVYEYIDNDIVMNNSPYFVGNINGYRYRSGYFDIETGWYYVGRYLDAVNGRYVDGLGKDELQDYINEYGYCLDIMLHNNSFCESYESSSDIVSMSTYAITTSTTREGQIEIIARTIYGESHYDCIDIACVAAVIRNRYVSNKTTAYQEVIMEDQFAAYKGDAYNQMPYDNLNTKELQYIYQCAVCLYNKSSLPSGYSYPTKEKYFYSVHSALTKMEYDPSTHTFIANWDGGTKHRFAAPYFAPYGGYFYSLSKLGMEQATYAGRYNVFYK